MEKHIHEQIKKPAPVIPVSDFLGNGHDNQTSGILEAANGPLNLTELLLRARIKVSDHFPVPPKALSFVHGDESAIYGTLGNFSLVTGKAKSKKTFLMVMVLAACVGHGILQGTIKCELPDDKLRVLLFDTEQSKYHVWKRLNAIASLAGPVDLSNIEVYSLREYAPDVRVELIEHALASNNHVGLVVIDGIRDLIHDINDPKEATYIATKLMQWTTLSWCHIITVLHQNKGDQNPRGHVGAELQNKAETVLSVTVQKEDKNVSVVEAEQTRDKDFPSFAFKVNDLGFPEIIREYEMGEADEKKHAGFDPYNIPPEKHLEILKKIFKDGRQYKRDDLISELRTAWGAFGQKLAVLKTRDLISYYSTTMGWIRNEGEIGRAGKWTYLSTPG